MAEIRVVDLMRQVQPCAPDDFCGSVVERFRADPGLRTIPVVTESRPTHLIHRESFLASFAGRYGFSLFNDRPLQEWLQRIEAEHLVLIPVSEGIDEAAMAISSITSHGGEATLIAVRDGRYSGLVGQGDLLSGLLATTRAQAAVLVEARDAALQASQAKSSFLATMSHEIRTPLTAIIGCSEVLIDSDLPEHSLEMAQIVHSSGRALLGLLNDLIDIARFEAGRVTLECHPFSLPECIQDVVALLGVSAKAKQLSLIFEGAEDLPTMVLGDQVRLRQILVNLIGNAVKFTERGRILVKAEPAGPGMVTISVADTGIGIPQAGLGKLFKPFSQVQAKDRRHEGAGLGLSISRHLVEMMDGDIHVASIPGQGTIFTVTLGLPTVGSDSGPRSEPIWRSTQTVFAVREQAGREDLEHKPAAGLGG